jgi:hypothetical protein
LIKIEPKLIRKSAKLKGIDCSILKICIKNLIS